MIGLVLKLLDFRPTLAIKRPPLSDLLRPVLELFSVWNRIFVAISGGERSQWERVDFAARLYWTEDPVTWCSDVRAFLSSSECQWVARV